MAHMSKYQCHAEVDIRPIKANKKSTEALVLQDTPFFYFMKVANFSINCLLFLEKCFNFWRCFSFFFLVTLTLMRSKDILHSSVSFISLKKIIYLILLAVDMSDVVSSEPFVAINKKENLRVPTMSFI